jgi:hypothetical protein
MIDEPGPRKPAARRRDYELPFRLSGWPPPLSSKTTDDPPDLRRILDHRDHGHLPPAVRAKEGVHLIYLRQKPGLAKRLALGAAFFRAAAPTSTASPTVGSSSTDAGSPTGICARPYQRSGALVLRAGLCFHVPRPRDEYTPYRRTRCFPLGGIWRVTRAIKSRLSKCRTSPFQCPVYGSGFLAFAVANANFKESVYSPAG